MVRGIDRQRDLFTGIYINGWIYIFVDRDKKKYYLDIMKNIRLLQVRLGCIYIFSRFGFD